MSEPETVGFKGAVIVTAPLIVPVMEADRVGGKNLVLVAVASADSVRDKVMVWVGTAACVTVTKSDGVCVCESVPVAVTSDV